MTGGVSPNAMLRAELTQLRKQLGNAQGQIRQLAAFSAALARRAGEDTVFIPISELEAAKIHGNHQFMPATGKRRPKEGEVNGDGEAAPERGILFRFIKPEEEKEERPVLRIARP